MLCVASPSQPSHMQSRHSPLAGRLNCAFTKDYSAHTSLQSKELRRRLTNRQNRVWKQVSGLKTRPPPGDGRLGISLKLKTWADALWW